VGRWLPAGASWIVDVGSGTGIWASAFARWFGVAVVGIEPSAAMRAQARAKGRPAGVGYVAGAAERLPVRTATCDAAWLSTVIHHVDDLGRCAAEVRRVLR